MRRPLVWLFLFYSAGIEIAWIWVNKGQSTVLFVLALLISMACMTKLLKDCKGVVSSLFLGILAFSAGFLAMSAELQRPEPLLSKIEMETEVVGTVLQAKQSGYGASLLLRPEGENSLLSRRTVWLSVKGTDQQTAETSSSLGSWVGWKIRVRGTVEKPEFPKNPGGFDQRKYLRTLGAQVVLRAEREDIQVLQAVTSRASFIRETLRCRWEPVMGQRSCGGLMSLLFGATDLMEDETLSAFQKIGLGHLLAVSGLHVGLVYAAVQKALGDKRNTMAAQMTCVAMTVGYAALASFSASACRAALMISIHSLGRVKYRRYDMASAAALAGLLILVRQPCQLLSGGLQLSLLAAFGLACVLPRISYSLELLADRRRSQRLRLAAEKLSPVLGIQLVMGPLCARRFHFFSFWSLALNPICIAAAGFLIPLAMVLSLLTMTLDAADITAESMAEGWISGVLLWGCRYLLRPAFLAMATLTGRFTEGLLNLGETASHWPGTFQTVGLPPGALLLYYCVLFLWCSESFFILLRRGRKRIAAGWVAAAVFACHWLPFWTGTATSPLINAYESYPIVFVDVGQGDCLHLRTPGGKNLLIDGGGSTYKNVGEKTLLPYLLYSGVSSVDLMLATHLHTDHFGGLLELSEKIPVGMLGVYEANQLHEKKFTDGEWKGSWREIIYLKAGDRIELEPQIYIDVLAPPKRSEEEYRRLIADDTDENDSCLIFKVHYQGLTLLVTGDMGMEGETDLLRAGSRVKADLLKVGHHGSRYSTSSDFLAAVDPKIAVISVGKNYFGHPSGRVIELLQKNDIMVGRTDRHGAVIVRRIARGSAEITNGNGEFLWHINLQKTKNTPISASRNS